MSDTTGFARDPALDALGIPVVFVVVRGLERTVPASVVLAAAEAFVSELLASTTYEAVAADATLAGYRDLHQRLNKTGRQYLPSPESLFKLLFKRGHWRAIDPLVDAYSLVALRRRVSIGAHDLSRLCLPVQLTVTAGGESFVPIGESTPLVLTPNEYAYRDAQGQWLGRMEVRQSAATCVSATSCDLLFIVQGHRDLPGPVLRDAAVDLLDSLRLLVGPYASASLSAID